MLSLNASSAILNRKTNYSLSANYSSKIQSLSVIGHASTRTLFNHGLIHHPYNHKQRVHIVAQLNDQDGGAWTMTRSDERVQEMHVYELNEKDRGSPAYLPFSFKFDFLKFLPKGALGDLVPFTNKVYDGSLQIRLGITAGLCVLIKNYPEKGGNRYEATYSFYFGDYGHISVQGSYLTFEDSYLAVTGGSGIFTGVYGKVKLQQIEFPYKIFYTFYLQGIDSLPEQLTHPHVPPSVSVKASDAAAQCLPGAIAPNFTD